MKFKAALALTALLAGNQLDARVLGRAIPELRLNDGTVLTQVTPMSYSAHQQTVVISTNRSLKTVPLNRFPSDLQSSILADYDNDRVRVEPNVVTTTVTPIPSPALISRTDGEAGEPPKNSLDQLLKQAAAEVGDELRLSLQQSHGRVSAVDCKIRSAEQVPGWQQIRVSGTASYSVWNHHDRDYVWRTGKFEVLFDIDNGEKLKANSVTFDGISRRVEH